MRLNYFDLAELRAQLAVVACTQGHRGGLLIVSDHGPHFGKIECPLGHYIDFAAAPRELADAKKRRPSGRPRLPEDEDYCWICNATKPALKLIGDRLVWAHKIDRAAALDSDVDPMDDDQMRVCAFHHRWIDAERKRWSVIAEALRRGGLLLDRPEEAA